ncbi:hypothetical protein WA538_004574 [Blastocystis sp. DL]
MGGIGKLLKKIDMNPSTEDSFLVRTTSGAVISVITVVIMSTLFWGELKLFLNDHCVEDMVIDKETRDRTIINLSIDFDYIPCDLLDVGYRDALGNDRADLENEIRKTNLDVNGNPIGVTDKSTIQITVPTKEEVLEKTSHGDEVVIVNTPKQTTCGSCYNAGSADDCCNTCEELIAKYRAKGLNLHGILAFAPVCADYDFLKKWETGVEKGCRIEGYIAVNKVQGHAYIVPSHVNDLVPMNRVFEASARMNVTHTINHFSLGDDIPVSTSISVHCRDKRLHFTTVAVSCGAILRQCTSTS